MRRRRCSRSCRPGRDRRRPGRIHSRAPPPEDLPRSPGRRNGVLPRIERGDRFRGRTHALHLEPIRDAREVVGNVDVREQEEQAEPPEAGSGRCGHGGERWRFSARVPRLLDRHALREVPRLVDVRPLQRRDVIRE
jgi:hypothetical protein